MTAAGPTLGLDVGTSSVKAAVVDAGGRVRGQAIAPCQVRAPRPGWAESDPTAWWTAIGTAARDAVAHAGVRPHAVGLSGQMHGIVVVGRTGTPLRPAILWADGRATEQLAAYRAMPAAWLARLANPLSPGMAGPLLAWVAQHEPHLHRDACWVLQPKDWVRLRLTGAVHSEPSDASATLLYDVPGDGWDADVVAAMGLDAGLLPPLVASTAVVGGLTSEAAAHLGLPTGAPVAAGAADTAAAIVGSGLPDGRVQLTIGTGGQLVLPMTEPSASPASGTHLYRTAAPTGWYAMAATLNAGLALQWVTTVLGAAWDELYASAAAPVAADDPLFLPHLHGERTPYLSPTMRGAWIGLSSGHDRAALLRAALEGVAFSLRVALEALPGAATVDRLRLAGGGSTHAAWRQLLADVLKRPLHAVDVPAVSARGAGLLAAVASGHVDLADATGALAPAASVVAEPRPEGVTRHADRLERYRRAVTAGIQDAG